MPGEPLALSTVPPPATADTDYDAICAAVTATARGRWFLDEYAKRNRHSDTTQVLTAIARMEAAVVGDRAQQASRQAHQEVQIELLEMARTIAQTRAAVAESRPDLSQHADAEPAGESAPDVAAAAERLRQIAWTMRACGIDLPASDQIGQIAETILSADALRNLGDRRAHKLTEALHYLEHRIDRMLDGHLAAAAAVAADDVAEAVADDPVANANGANDNDHHADAAILTPAAPLVVVATALETEARTEPAPRAEGDSAAAAIVAEASAAEFPMDDDVVLTVTDHVTEAGPESEPRPEVAWSPELPPEPTTSSSLMREPESAIEAVEPIRGDEGIEPMPVPTTSVVATALQDERAEPAAAATLVAPAAAADVEHDSDTEAALGALGLEPLVVVPAVAALQGGLPSAAAQIPAQEPTQEQIQPADVPASAVASAADVGADEPVAELSQVGADEPDAIAMQVEQDLDQLADVAPVASTGDAAPAWQEAPAAGSDLATAATADDPAEFLLEAPAEMSPDHAPMAALVASAQATRAQLSSALAAIETELSAAATPIPVHTDAATAMPPADGPLAALMLLSEEERLALFS
jgi:chemotaxis protein CheZ